MIVWLENVFNFSPRRHFLIERNVPKVFLRNLVILANLQDDFKLFLIEMKTYRLARDPEPLRPDKS